MKPAILALALLAASFAAQAVDGTFRFYGYAYDLDSGRYLYTEVHEPKIVADKWVSGRIRYFDPQNKLIGDKLLDFSADPYIPIFELKLFDEGYAEAITAVGERITMKKTRKGKEPQTETITRKSPMAADSGFHNLLRANFAELLTGKVFAFNFVVAGNLDSYKFKAKRIEDTTVDGVKAVRFKVDPDSLLRLVAPSLTLTYDPVQQKLLDYRGISNVHDPKTGDAYSVRIVYPEKPPSDAPKILPPLE